MGKGISEVLTFAIGVAISPVPIIAVILMLLSQWAKVNGPMFLAGWALALAVVTGAVYFTTRALFVVGQLLLGGLVMRPLARKG